MKIVIVVLLLLIIVSLFFALFAFYKDREKEQSTRMVKALYIRVGLSAALIAIILVGYKMGYLKPGMNPAKVDQIVEHNKKQKELKDKQKNTAE